MDKLTYRVYSVFDPDHENNVFRSEFELATEVDISSEDWKIQAEKIQLELHALLGTSERLKYFKKEIFAAETQLSRILTSIQAAVRVYKGSREFLVAQGLGSKMPDFPFDLEDFLNDVEQSKKLLPPGDYDD